VELLLVHPKSAGHGLNLQFGGSKMVFLSLPWSLDRYEQTIGRLHRSGQKNAVYCYVLLTDKTVDERIFASLHDKTDPYCKILLAVKVNLYDKNIPPHF
jgi:SNF2 family DNA or RNA helicase